MEVMTPFMRSCSTFERIQGAFGRITFPRVPMRGEADGGRRPMTLKSSLAPKESFLPVM